MHFWSYSVQYGPIWSTSVNFYSIRSDLVHIGPIRSTLVRFAPIWFYSINSIHFSLIRSLWSNSVHFGQTRSIISISVIFGLILFYSVHCGTFGLISVHFGSMQSIRYTLFYSVPSVLFGPLWSYLVHFTELWSYSVHLVYSLRFGPFRSYSVQFVPTLSTLVHCIIFGPNQFTSVTKQFFYLGSAQSHIKWTEVQAQHITSLNRLEFFFTGPNPNPTISNNAFQLQILTCSHKVQNETAATSENEAM